MTLAELLALLPDNDTGEIDAADLRTIVTELWNQGASVSARVTDLEQRDGGGDTLAVTGRWQVNPQAGASPGGKQVTASSGEWPLATWLRFDPTDLNNNDLSAALEAATDVLIQQQSDSGNWARYSVSGPATSTEGYVEVAVAYINGDGGIASAQWQEAQVVIRVPA